MGKEFYDGEMYDEEYSQYLTDLGEIELSDSEQELSEDYQVDEYNELADGDMETPHPDEDITEYEEYWGAPVPAMHERSVEEIDMDGLEEPTEEDYRFLAEEARARLRK